MKCPHCNKVHPNHFLFCPVTGKEIKSLKACTNKSCLEYGKMILPPDSLFCPSCGKKIGSTHSGVNDKSNKKTKKKSNTPKTSKRQRNSSSGKRKYDSQLEERIVAIIVDKLGVEASEVKMGTDLRDLGADDLDIVELIMEFEKEFGFIFPDELSNITTPGQALDVIWKQVIK